MIRGRITSPNKNPRQWDVRQVLPIVGVFVECCSPPLLTLKTTSRCDVVYGRGQIMIINLSNLIKLLNLLKLITTHHLPQSLSRSLKFFVEILAQSPQWEPGVHEGKPVPVMFTIPVVFSL